MVANTENTAESQVNAQIHVSHLAVIRLGKAMLVAAIEAGAVLQQERNRRGDDFEDWVTTKLALSPNEARCYIRFYEETSVRADQLSPAVEVKLPQVLEQLGQLNAGFPGCVAAPHHLEPANGVGDRQTKRNRATDVVDSPAKQGRQLERAAGQPAKDEKRSRKRTGKTATNSSPVPQSRNDRQSALTPEQRQFLVRRSPRLLAQVRKGDLRPEEALQLAQELPDRSLPRKPQPR